MNYQLELDSEVQQYIQNHLEESFPNEGCGFFYGREEEEGLRKIIHAEAVLNSKKGDQARRFEITPLDYVKAERRAEEMELQLLGIYHSHPNHPAIPSDFDLQKALPYFSYLILSVQEGKAATLTSWRLEEEERHFTEEKVKTLNTINQ